MQKLSQCLFIAAVAGAVITPAMAQQKARPGSPEFARVGTRSRMQPAYILYQGVRYPIHSPGNNQDAPTVIYDNTTGTSYFYATTAAPTGRLDHIGWTAGLTNQKLTSVDEFEIVLPPADPGGDVGMEFTFFSNVDETVTSTTVPVNTGQIGNSFTIVFQGLPPNTNTLGAGWIPNAPIDISTLNLVVPQDNCGIQCRPVVANATTTHPTAQVGFMGSGVNTGRVPGADVYWRDSNLNGIFDGGDARFFNGPPTLANFDLKFEGDATTTGGCYANCDQSTGNPALNANDFQCFLNAYAVASTLPNDQQITDYANCDQSTGNPALNANDFQCFLNAFAVGCS
jgi:hypothetical protein